MKDEKVCVYDIVTDGVIVYVGITNNPKYRYTQHKYSGVAGKNSRMAVVKWHDTRRLALDAEAKRIEQIRPELNFYREKRVKEEKEEFDWVAQRKKIDEFNEEYTVEEVEEYIRRNSLVKTHNDLLELARWFQSIGRARLGS